MLYRVTTGNACFGIVVEDGVVTEAAPIAAKIAGISSSIVGQPWDAGQFRNAELVPPVGWLLQAGMSGWRCVNKGKLWSTNVFIAPGGAEKAVEAAIELEEKAVAEIERRQALCAALRTYFSS